MCSNNLGLADNSPDNSRRPAELAQRLRGSFRACARSALWGTDLPVFVPALSHIISRISAMYGGANVANLVRCSAAWRDMRVVSGSTRPGWAATRCAQLLLVAADVSRQASAHAADIQCWRSHAYRRPLAPRSWRVPVSLGDPTSLGGPSPAPWGNFAPASCSEHLAANPFPTLLGIFADSLEGGLAGGAPASQGGCPAPGWPHVGHRRTAEPAELRPVVLRQTPFGTGPCRAAQRSGKRQRRIAGSERPRSRRSQSGSATRVCALQAPHSGTARHRPNLRTPPTPASARRPPEVRLVSSGSVWPGGSGPGRHAARRGLGRRISCS